MYGKKPGSQQKESKEMSSAIIKKNTLKQKRKYRVRKTLCGTAARPRLSVFKSIKNMSVQLIDDENGVTICSGTTHSKGSNGKTRSKDAVQEMGTRVGLLAKEKGITALVFDRGPYKYHGLVAILADAVRAQGIQF